MRGVDSQLLQLAAEARAALAMVEGVVGAGGAAIMVGPGRWLVRGAAGRVSPVWARAHVFAEAVRSVRSGPLDRGGVLLARRDGAWCGLCGGVPASPMDRWAAEHPLTLAGSW